MGAIWPRRRYERLAIMKPKINAKSARFLCMIDRLIKLYDIRGPQRLRDAASDALDGYALRRELDDLVRRRFLDVIPTGERAGDRGSDLCGTNWTVDLTERAMIAFWPKRVANHSSTTGGNQ